MAWHSCRGRGKDKVEARRARQQAAFSTPSAMQRKRAEEEEKRDAWESSKRAGGGPAAAPPRMSDAERERRLAEMARDAYKHDRDSASD
eukprot:CAMPEP_0206129880 /NCGR_PEP_ID=MMETSP1472-20131121/38192_1 /ASSEMBLY_ACC=CAM_ASM_001108 /TAXON_ID=41880 /ORGANISM="Pycnococcus provasolii, Strain RCC251" /LENGTH=88 /DNA_ID=CAMNT_0053521173 /DNA_START=267 /DNA_END=530 /DNA_ORIENTATION=-